MRLHLPGLLLALGATPSLVAAQVQVIATRGQTVPGSTETFSSFDLPVLNKGGRVLFTYQVLFGPAGIALWRGGSLGVVVFQSDLPPGGAVGEDYASLRASGPALNACGDFVFGGRVDLVGTNVTDDIHVFVDAQTGPALLAREPQAEPGGDGTLFFRGNVHATINALGATAFSASLLGTSGGGADDEAVYRIDPPGSALVEIVRKGEATPNGDGTFAGTAFQASQAFADPSMNRPGVVVFQASILGGMTLGDNGIFVGDGTTVSRIIRHGDPVPGGGTFASFSKGPIDDNGRVAFAANYVGGSALDGVFHSDGQSVTAVALNGQPAPDAAGNPVGTFTVVDPFLTQNECGQILFQFGVVPGGSGLFRWNDPGLTAIARPGQAAPNGGTFTHFDAFAMNDRGQVLFRGRVESPGPSFDRGIFLFDDNTGLTEIIREGDLLLGQSVLQLDMSGTRPNTFVNRDRTGLNDAGHAAFTFVLADGTRGVATTVPVVSATASVRNAGSNPLSHAADPPVLGSTWNASVDLTTTGHTLALVVGRLGQATVPLSGGRFLLVGGPRIFKLPTQAGPLASWSVPIPEDAALIGASYSTQGLHLTGVVPFTLSNAVDQVIGF